MKHKTSVTLDAENIEFARKLGLNLSQFTNEQLNQLRTAIQNSKLEPRAGFGPATITLPSVTSFDWAKYDSWIDSKAYSRLYTTTLKSNSRKYLRCLLNHDLSSIRDLPLTLQPGALKALSSLSHFLGVTDLFKKDRENFGISWQGKSSTQLVCERIAEHDSSADLIGWIDEVKRKRPGFNLFLDLMIMTGLRLSEAVNCWNLLVKQGLSGYYNEARATLEHYKFGKVFLRPHKNAFFSFARKAFLEEIAEHKYHRQPFNDSNYLLHSVARAELPSRFSDLREFHATFMTTWLKPEEIDFLHGRVSGSVFKTNYYNPSLMDGLRDRAFQGIDAIMEKVQA